MPIWRVKSLLLTPGSMFSYRTIVKDSTTPPQLMAPQMTRQSYRPNNTANAVTDIFSGLFANQVNQSAIAMVTAVCLLAIGCGKSEVSTAQGTQPAGNSTASPQTDSVASADVSSMDVSPTDIVSQFLDQVRRGGANSNAGRFLTQKAQSELQRIGRSVQPIGSPDAHFDVIRAVTVPDQDNAMLVESRWTEPNPDGTNSQFQVVWSVEKETVGWRISGLAMELDGTEAPTIIDFENGTMMAQLLADDPAPQSDNPSQAAAPSEGLNR